MGLRTEIFNAIRIKGPEGVYECLDAIEDGIQRLTEDMRDESSSAQFSKLMTREQRRVHKLKLQFGKRWFS